MWAAPFSYVLAIPALAWGMDFGGQYMATLTGTLREIWNSQIRYFGIGAMVVAGVYSIIKIGGSMGAAIKTAARGVRGSRTRMLAKLGVAGVVCCAAYTSGDFCLAA